MRSISRRADIVRTMPGYNAQDLFTSEGWDEWSNLDADDQDVEPELDPPTPPDEEGA